MMKTKARSIDATAFLEMIGNQNGRKNSAEPSWLTGERRAAKEALRLKGFPSQKDERYRYTNIGPLIAKQYNCSPGLAGFTKDSLEVFRQKGALEVVFVNGIFSPELSMLSNMPENFSVKPIGEAILADPEKVRGYFRETDFGEDAFSTLNKMIFDKGVYIECGDGFDDKRAIHILHYFHDDDAPFALFPRNLIILHPRARAGVIESYASQAKGPYYVNAHTGIYLDSASKLDYCRLECAGEASFHMGFTHIQQKRDSKLNSFSLTLGAKMSRHNLHVKLSEEGSEAGLYGLYAVREKNQSDHYTRIDHLSPNAVSRQIYKGLIDDEATAVFNGKVFVHKGARLTSSSQVNKNLLLSHKAHIHTLPQLEIYADDIRCTHGATAGQVSEEDIFYLQSRAIGREAAIRMLALGFVDDILNSIGDRGIMDYLHGLIINRFKKL